MSEPALAEELRRVCAGAVIYTKVVIAMLGCERGEGDCWIEAVGGSDGPQAALKVSVGGSIYVCVDSCARGGDHGGG